MTRVLREETLCHDSLTQSERPWLQSNRSDEAKHWNLLTDLSPEHLSHAKYICSLPLEETSYTDFPTILDGAIRAAVQFLSLMVQQSD